MTRPSPARERIRSAAESLFAQRGYAGVSLREITAAASANVAALNYHFYDTEKLYLELLRQRLHELGRERLALLAQAQPPAGTDPVPLAGIFDALARPLFHPEKIGGTHSARLIARLLVERQPFTEPLIRQGFEPVMTQFGRALRRHQPRLPPSDFLWRVSFVTGALHHAIITLPDMTLYTRGLCDGEDRAGALRSFILFAAKAFRDAPS